MAHKVIEKILTGLSDNNIRFSKLRSALIKLNFSERVKGNHHIFTRDNVKEIINIQPLKNGKAKPYQVKQIRNIILAYKLHREVMDV